jgi:hypothetical protein
LTLVFADGFTPAIDPTISGAQIRLLSNAGDTFESRHELPAARWRTLRNRNGVRGYRYTDRRGAIRRVVIRSGGDVTVRGAGIGLQLALGHSPDPVDVVFTLGAERACLRFGGTPTFTPGKRYEAAAAAAPAACAP